MATVSRYPLVAHLRAEPNQYILHFKNGTLAAQGAGLAYWFLPLSASVAQVPVEDIETTFMVVERTADFQEVSVQITVRYRCEKPEEAAKRVNFAIELARGTWQEEPLQKLASFWAQRAAAPARAVLTGMTVAEAAQSGAEALGRKVEAALRADKEITEMGLLTVSVHVVRVAPTAEVEKALQTPTREAIQTKADEATFSRRALAVEKERAIKENELNNQIELARKEEQLITQTGANALSRVRHEAESERARAQGQAERDRIAAETVAHAIESKSRAEAQGKQALWQVDIDAEARRLSLYENLPASVGAVLAAQQLAGKIQTINHLNVSPDLLGSSFTEMLRRVADK